MIIKRSIHKDEYPFLLELSDSFIVVKNIRDNIIEKKLQKKLLDKFVSKWFSSKGKLFKSRYDIGLNQFHLMRIYPAITAEETAATLDEKNRTSCLELFNEHSINFESWLFEPAEETIECKMFLDKVESIVKNILKEMNIVSIKQLKSLKNTKSFDRLYFKKQYAEQMEKFGY